MSRGLRFLFTLERRVSRRAYALAGVGLMALKYGVEVLAVHRLTGQWWTPVDYFVPLQSLRAERLARAPDGFLVALAIWTLAYWRLVADGTCTASTGGCSSTCGRSRKAREPRGSGPGVAGPRSAA